MKLFRNKNTEEMYISLTDSKDNLMDFNGNIVTCSAEDYGCLYLTSITENKIR